MIAFHIYHNRPLLSNEAVLLQDLGWPREALFNSSVRKWATEEIKWVLIRTVWALGWLHLNQSKESSGKSTPCFHLAYMFYSCGGNIRGFFPHHLFSFWFILISSRKSINQEEFSLTGISSHIPWILMTSRGWWDISDSPGLLQVFFWALAKFSQYLSSHSTWLCQSGSSGLLIQVTEPTWNE